MIGKEKYVVMREMLSLGFTEGQIARRVRVDLRTVKRYVYMPEAEFDGLGFRARDGLSRYRDYILDILKVCPQVRDTNLLYRLREAFPDFNYKRTTFFRYMKDLREESGYVVKDFSRRRGIRETPSPGFEAQVDFGQVKMQDMYGITRRIYFFIMVLSFCNMRFVYFNHDPFTTKTAIIAHEYAFKYFGGRPQMIVYDQDRVFTVSENLGDIVFVKEFEDYVKRIGFSIYLCKGSDPSSKGRVEALVGHTKHHFLDGRIYCGIDVLNSQCLEWLDNGCNITFNVNQRQIPKQLFEEEYKHLVKVPVSSVIEKNIFRIRKENQVLYKHNSYAIPHKAQFTCEFARIEEDDGFLNIYNAVTNEFLCKYKIPQTKGNVLCADDSTASSPASPEHLLILFDRCQAIQNFVETLKQKVPRYASRQCVNIISALRYFKKESVLEAIEHCNKTNRVHIQEFVGYLIYRHGKAPVRKFTTDAMMVYSIKRANAIKEEYNGRNTND
ncbi:MAG: DDE-type integrase/transposase/recombinase [Bacillota bacterium]